MNVLLKCSANVGLRSELAVISKTELLYSSPELCKLIIRRILPLLNLSIILLEKSSVLRRDSTSAQLPEPLQLIGLRGGWSSPSSLMHSVSLQPLPTLYTQIIFSCSSLLIPSTWLMTTSGLPACLIVFVFLSCLVLKAVCACMRSVDCC